MIVSMKTVIGEQEWSKRLQEEDDGALTVLGLYQGESQRDRKATNHRCGKRVPGEDVEEKRMRILRE